MTDDYDDEYGAACERCGCPVSSAKALEDHLRRCERRKRRR